MSHYFVQQQREGHLSMGTGRLPSGTVRALPKQRCVRKQRALRLAGTHGPWPPNNTTRDESCCSNTPRLHWLAHYWVRLRKVA